MTRKPTRRKHYPLVNPMEIARHRASKLSPEQREDLLAPARHAIEALVRGAGTRDVWQQCADVYNLAEALCELSIAGNIVDMVHGAQAALAQLMGRVHAGRGWTLYGPEVGALREGLWLYGVQLSYCSAGEHLRAIELVRNRISGALAGNAGPRATVHQAPGEAAA
jgi:hypothetical protein